MQHEAPHGPLGELGLALSVDGGLEVDSIHYEISGNGVARSGTIPVAGSGATFTATISDIPAGTGYAIKLTATPVNDSSYACMASATFSIVGGKTTQANLILQCDQLDDSGAVNINGQFNVCPSIRSSMVTPTMQSVGATIALSATARDVDMGPGPLSYTWSVSHGAFQVANQVSTTASGPTATLLCNTEGAATITLEVSDGDCKKSQMLTATCVGADAGVDASTPDASAADAGSDASTGDAGSGTDAGTTPAALVRINEIESKDGVPGDWVELYNAGNASANLSGYILSDDKKTHTYTFAAGTSLAVGGYLVVEQAALGYGLGDSDAVRLWLPDGKTAVDGFAWISPATTTYGRCPNGTGMFTTTAVSTKGSANSCGAAVEPRVVINELQTKGDKQGDFIELFNTDVVSVDVSGWVVKDKSDASQYVIPAGTQLDPGTYLSIDQSQLGFGFNQMDAARLFDTSGSTVVDFYSWSAHPVNTWGRCPNGTGPFVDTAGATRNTVNNCAVTVPAAKVVINEVESKDGDPGDWVELYNAGSATADVSGWVLKDKNDNDAYQIPANTTLAAGAYLVLNQAQFMFNLGAVDATRLYLFQSGTQTLADSYAWATHATTTYGRCPNGTGPFVTTVSPTKGLTNSCPAQ